MNHSLTKKMVALLMAVLLVIALLPAAAFAADTASSVEVKLTPGKETVSINGKATVVQAPYVASGTTMVPLKIITNAFGAALKLENGNGITLTYNDRKVELTFGSKTVKVNGVSKTVAVAPVVIKGSTMVPLRVIVEAFGAKISIDKKTSEVTIKGVRAQSTGGGSTTIDSDYGKTKVGDSYQGWSLNYPAALVQVEQSDSGDYVRWADAKEDAQVIILTEPMENELSSSEQREELFLYFDTDEYSLDERTVKVGNYSFEKIVARTKDSKMFYEYRGIQQGEKFYIIIVGVKATDKSALNGYQALLDSFQPSFEKNDKALKDITKVKDGFISYADEDYGFAVKLPASWYKDNESDEPYYFSKDDDLEFSFTSLEEGDTLEKWAARNESTLKADFVNGYLRNVSSAPIKLQDGNAIVFSYELTFNQKDWYAYKEVMFVSGSYKYVITYGYEASTALSSSLSFNQIIGSIDIDTGFIDNNFGYKQDTSTSADNRDGRVTKRSSAYGYSIELPTFWYGYSKDFNAEEVMYNYQGGFMNILYLDDIQASDYPQAVQQYANSADGIKAEAKVLESTNVTINGKSAYKIALHTKVDILELGRTEYAYVFDTVGGVVLFVFSINDANATESNLKRMEETVQSIRFN
ncbi:stalk domain-containing protein [Paenibacillus sp. 2TAB19]|uniref:stalk domain-containing protein n=1 Tax=Paenibacillus sp. 2TAB19 TaxID=3233003 RepID=UPI003F9CAD54